MTRPPADPARTVGRLCVGGDWACASGDLETLGHIARELSVLAHEPLHCEFVALAEMCLDDPDRAVGVWLRLKNRLLA